MRCGKPPHRPEPERMGMLFRTAQSGVGRAVRVPEAVLVGVAEDDAVMLAVSEGSAPTDSEADGLDVPVGVLVQPLDSVAVVEGVDRGVDAAVLEGLKPAASVLVPDGVREAVLERVAVLDGVGCTSEAERSKHRGKAM